MATIRKLPSGNYNVQVRRDGHPPLSDTFPNRPEAKAWATKIENDINQGKHYGFSRVRTLADAVDDFTGRIACLNRDLISRPPHIPLALERARPATSRTAKSSKAVARWHS